MTSGSLLGLILTIAAFIFIMYKINSATKKTKPERTQDLFQFKRITDDGYIEMLDGTYRAMIEIEPVNMYLKAPEEQETVWMQFRDMLNSIHAPVFLMIQSRHKEIRSYTASLRDQSSNMSEEPLQKFGFELADYLENEISEAHVKDHRYYVVIDVDPHIQEGDIEIPSEMVSNFVRGFQKRLSPREAEDLAKQELDDNIVIIATYFNSMGLNVYRMNKNAILEMAYSSLNRDLAPVMDYTDIVRSSSIQTTSVTKTAVEEEMGADYFEKLSAQRRNKPILEVIEDDKKKQKKAVFDEEAGPEAQEKADQRA